MTLGHFFLHLAIGIGEMVAGILIVRVISKLMYTPILWRVCTIGFTFTAGVGSFAVAFGDRETGALLVLTSGLELVFVVGFIVTLLQMTHRLVLRLSNALEAIRMEFDGLPIVTSGRLGRELVDEGKARKLAVGSAVLATLNFASFGRKPFPTPKERRGDDGDRRRSAVSSGQR